MKLLQQVLKHALLPHELTKTKKPHYKKLHARFSDKHRSTQTRLWHKHKNALEWVGKNFSPHHLRAGSLGSLMLLAPISTAAFAAAPATMPVIEKSEAIDSAAKKAYFITDLQAKVPSIVRPLLHEEEEAITGLLTEHYKIPITAEIDGKRLNRSYGYIGAEQHLARYPGDTMATHFDSQEDANAHYSSGMAPGLGAWGHFASSASEFSEKDKQREKYYIAVQTFLSPGYNEHVHEYYQFYKHRKMILINPENGKAMIVVVGDAGPAEWTGKSLGGSPEVMKYLERVDGRARGPVLYFFVNDPNDTLPLGPISVPETT